MRTMKRIRFRIPSWEEGKQFMTLIEKHFQVEVKTIDADLKIQTDSFSLSCHFDSREFSHMNLKIFNPDIESELQNHYKKYLK
jgi:hypothetical protein